MLLNLKSHRSVLYIQESGKDSWVRRTRVFELYYFIYYLLLIFITVRKVGTLTLWDFRVELRLYPPSNISRLREKIQLNILTMHIFFHLENFESKIWANCLKIIKWINKLKKNLTNKLSYKKLNKSVVRLTSNLTNSVWEKCILIFMVHCHAIGRRLARGAYNFWGIKEFTLEIFYNFSRCLITYLFVFKQMNFSVQLLS